MLIYLDIDGVMVPASSWRKPKILEDGFPEFSSRAIRSLNRIISSFSAEIVLTTSHKYKYTLDQWKDIFRRRNIPVNKISRLPMNNQYLSRKEELMNWFSIRDQEKDFLIIDDDKSLNSLPLDLKINLIQTSGTVGLTDYLVDEILEKIQNQSSSYSNK